MKKLIKIGVIGLFMVLISIPNLSIADTPWSVKVTKRGGKNTPCGVRFKTTYHSQVGNKEVITCTGRGNLDCPSPNHTAGEVGIANIEEAVTSGGVSGTLIDWSSLTISTFSDGSINEDGSINYEAVILIFENEASMQEYLNQ